MGVTELTRRILSGEPLPIEEPVPDCLAAIGVTEWYMAQPEDWLYDDAQLEWRAVHSAAMEAPSVRRVAHLPVSDAFRERQRLLLEEAETMIAKLSAKTDRTADEEHNLASLRDLLAYIVNPDEMNRAQELANDRARRARDSYLMPRLIVDADGRALFDVETDDGRALWNRVPRRVKYGTLQVYLNTILADIREAKNYDGGADSESGTSSPPSTEWEPDSSSGHLQTVSHG